MRKVWLLWSEERDGQGNPFAYVFENFDEAQNACMLHSQKHPSGVYVDEVDFFEREKAA